MDQSKDKDQLFEIYIRNQDGDTRYCNLRDGLKEFMDDDNGYRLSINIEGVVITLRRDHAVSDQMRFLDEHLNQTSLDCSVTIRGMESNLTKNLTDED